MGLEGFNPSQLASYRFLVASLSMLPFLIFRKMQLPNFKEAHYIVIISSIGISCYQIALNVSTIYFEPNVVSFVSNSMPAFIVVFATFFLRERNSIMNGIGVFVAIIGIGVLNFQEVIVLKLEMFVLLVTPLSAAIFFVFQKPLLKSLKSYEVMFYSILTGTIILLLYDSSFIGVIHEASHKANWAAIYLGVIPTAIGFNLWAHVLSIRDVSYASKFMYFTPLSTVLFSSILLNQAPDLQQIAGGTIILMGVYLARRIKPIDMTKTIKQMSDFPSWTFYESLL
jgi:drug/metabolite transporter (DMT)-like permease